MRVFQTIVGKKLTAPLKGILCGSFLFTLQAHAQLDDGIYAVFDTSMGSYTSELFYVEAPITVANFIGLAEGSRAWLDLNTGRARTAAFYDGTTYHRVISGFMLQGGSPNAMGTDGPGYSFVDEVDNGLLHSAPGVLSMANSGLNSNGSQFFTTLAATSWLDGLHTVFGQVIGGMDVVNAIGLVTTDTSNKPLTDVVINAVTVIRVGSDAESFDIEAQGLPLVDATEISGITPGQQSTLLDYAPEQFDFYHASISTNLVDFVKQAEASFFEAPGTNFLLVSSTNQPSQKHFFSLAEVDYQQDLYTPASMSNRVLELTFTNPEQAGLVLTISFDNTGSGGTYDLYDGSTHNAGNLTSYTYVRDPLRGSLRPIQYDGLVPMVIHLATDSPSSDRWGGTLYLNTGQQAARGTYRYIP